MIDFLTETEIFGCSLYEVLLWFLVYGVFGWVFESAVVSNNQKKFVNRGFLFGPFIPIYSFGITGFAFLLNPINNLKPIMLHLSFLPDLPDHPEVKQDIGFEYKYFVIFIAGGIIASILEFTVFTIMEGLFNQRWWDYTEYKYNNHGKTCLPITIMWCLLSVIAIKFVHPYIGKMVSSHLPPKIGVFVIIIGYALLLADSIASAVVASKKKKKLESEKEGEE